MYLHPSDCGGNDIFSTTLAEGNRTLGILSDPNAELLSFVTLFPCGRYRLSTDRVSKLHFRNN